MLIDNKKLIFNYIVFCMVMIVNNIYNLDTYYERKTHPHTYL